MTRVPEAEREGAIPQVILPAASVVDGVLVERDIRTIRGAGVQKTSVACNSQVTKAVFCRQISNHAAD